MKTVKVTPHRIRAFLAKIAVMPRSTSYDIMVAMRMNSHDPLAYERFTIGANSLLADGLVTRDNNRYTITEKGWIVVRAAKGVQKLQSGLLASRPKRVIDRYEQMANRLLPKGQ